MVNDLRWDHLPGEPPTAELLNRIETTAAALSALLLGYGYSAPVRERTAERVTATTELVEIEETLVATGAEQRYTVPMDGDYTITATGAAGAGGNAYSGYATVGGKGARLTALLPLRAGDVLRIVVGTRGACTQATAKDGTSGGGGGCTMVLREIDAVSDSRYQFVKSGQAFEVLLLAAGGGGGNDGSYKSAAKNGVNGEAAAFCSPVRYTAASTAAGTASTSSVMGVQQYITNNATGAVYSRNSGKAQGGYGCGGASDDTQACGGGWCAGSTALSAQSWSLDENAVGVNGVGDGDGAVALSLRAEITTTTTEIAHDWTREDFLTPGEIARIRENINALQAGFYSLPDWRELVQRFCPDGRETLDAEQVNAEEWDLHAIGVWIDRMAAAFLYAGEIFAGEVTI